MLKKMRWFNKKRVGKQEEAINKLPELPKLPDFPPIKEDDSIGILPQLPSFPNNYFGEKFSQNAIKHAVTGEKEGENAFETENSEEEPEEFQMFQRHTKKPLTKETSSQIPEKFEETATMVKKTEPIFIRIDKFEESLQIFEKTKTQISEIEKMLKEIKNTKDEEEKELQFWENEMQVITRQIEKVDKEIFSKI